MPAEKEETEKRERKNPTEKTHNSLHTLDGSPDVGLRALTVVLLNETCLLCNDCKGRSANTGFMAEESGA